MPTRRSHYDPAGLAIDRWRSSPIWDRPGWWMRAAPGDEIGAELVEAHWSPGVSRMLFRTFDQFPTDRWPSRFTVVSAEAVRRWPRMA